MGHHGGFGGDATNIRVGPFAVIGVMVMIIGMVVIPFRYPMVTLKVIGVSAVLSLYLGIMSVSPTAGLMAPILIIIAYYLSRGEN